MNIEDAVKRLRDLNWDDPEWAHAEADEILLGQVPKEVSDAYKDLVALCDWWVTA